MTAAPLPGFDDGARLRIAVAFALLVHVGVIYGVRFAPPAPPAALQTLEVTLARFRDERVREADFLAQQDQGGSGDAATAVEMRSPSEAPLSAERAAAVAPAVAMPPPRPAAATQAISRLDSGARARDVAAPVTESALPDMQQRAPLDVTREVATLNARLAAEAAEQARGPRVRRITSVSTRTAVEAYYVQSWRREIERLGNLNFPQDAGGGRLYGSLRLLVAIEPSGALHEVTVLESSGQPLLDQAAIRIVRLAAPFAPFPPEMRAAMDRLEIIRTWSFRRTSGAGGFAM